MGQSLPVGHSPAAQKFVARDAAIAIAQAMTRAGHGASGEERLRIILVRHGKPAIPMNPRTCHRGFRKYIDAYQGAGLDPGSLPPATLVDLVTGLDAVFTSPAPRATDS